MGKIHKRLGARRKKIIRCQLSDDSGISMKGGTDTGNTTLSGNSDLNENSKIQEKCGTLKQASGFSGDTEANCDNIRITVQNTNNCNNIESQDILHLKTDGAQKRDVSPTRQFTFDTEENFLDYEPEHEVGDLTVSEDELLDEDQLLNEDVFNNTVESFQEPSNLNEVPSVDLQNNVEREFSVNRENVDQEAPGKNYLHHSMLDENQPQDNFLKNANVMFNGTNITIMRPFSREVQTSVSNQSHQRNIPPNESVMEKVEKVQIQMNHPIIQLPASSITNCTTKKDSSVKVWSDSKIDLCNSKIASGDDIFLNTAEFQYSSQNVDTATDITGEGLDYMSCTSVLDLSDDQAYEIFDNASVYSETSSRASSKTSSNFQESINNRQTHLMNSSNRENIGSIYQDDISDSYDYHISSENATEEFDDQASNKQEFVTRWLNGNDIGIEYLIDSLCEAYFTSICEKFQCEKLHLHPDEVGKRIKQLPLQKLTKIYTKVREHMVLYMGLFSTFLDRFKGFSTLGRAMLVDMIKDIFIVFNGSFIDKTVYVQKIVVALQDTGVSFKMAIDTIISKYGTSQITLSDILLFLISKEPNLDENWCIIKKLIHNRKEKLDHEVVTNLLNVALNYPHDRELWTAFLKDIVRNNLVFWKKIPQTLLEKINMSIPIDDLFNHMSTNSESDTYERPSFDYDELSEQSASYDTSTQMNDSLTSSDNDVNSECSERLNGTFNQRVLSSLDSNENRNQVLHHVYNRKQRKNDQNISTIFKHNSVNAECIDEETDTIVPSSEIDQRLNTHDVFKVPTDRRIKKLKRKRSVAFRRNESNSDEQPGGAYSEKVLRKINDALNPPARPQTPANIVAHPTQRPLINTDYQCNVSLHNLYPSNTNGIEMSHTDLLRLKKSLEAMNVEEFLSIFSSYQNSFTIQNFVLHTLILLKNQTHKIDIFKQFVSLQAGLEKVKSNYMEDHHLKMLVEVLAMNLIYLLEKKGKWDLSRNILLGMKKRDWHSLVTSKIFFCKSRVMSHMCRYIFIVKIFVHAKDFHWANEIFQCNELKLLEPTSNWPFQHARSDVKFRNEVLKLFLTEGFSLNFVIVNDLLKHIAIVIRGSIEGVDIWTLFDKQICDMLDSETRYRSVLQILCGDVIKCYGRFLSNETLKGYLLYMQDTISETDAYQLYKCCCDRKIYNKYTGQEHVIVIETNMNDFEINLVLKQYLENMLKGSVTLHDFRIELKLSELSAESIGPEILRNKSDRNAFSIFASIINILRKKFSIYVERTDNIEISVTRQMLESASWK